MSAYASGKAENNKRIAKNTLMLYARMLIMTLVNLYTSRVVLNALGVEDFGIYNVVGGVVAMFTILSGSVTAAISRFITFELGEGDIAKLQRIFSTAVTIQFGLGLLVVLLAETVGLWFLYSKMSIPDGRMLAANWVLQFSLVAFVINLISVPYNALIIAHERMSVFAYIGIFEAVAKLGVGLLILVAPIDRLIFYAVMMCAVALAVRMAYGWYCKRHFEECSYQFIFDRRLLHDMSGFAGWNFIGASSTILRDQGGNILINIFFGPGVNAARGVAVQVSHAIMNFANNFMTALNPQIIKSYATGDHGYMMTLVYQGARLSYYMLLLLSLPIIISTHYILVVWLGIVPDHTVAFVQLSLLLSMSEALSNPLIIAMLATGRIRDYQIVVGGLNMLNLPIAYVLLNLGLAPESVFFVAICLSQICLFARIYMLKRIVRLSLIQFVRNVYLNVIAVTAVAIVVPIAASIAVSESFVVFIGLSLLSLVSTATAIYFIGCNREEKLKARAGIIRIVKKLPIRRHGGST